MAVLAKGTVTDRPWGQTLGALSKRGLSGQLTVTTDGKPYRIAFTQGAIVGATSPLASDAAVRIAMTGGLISSTQVNDITRRITSSPHRDEVEVIAEAARLAPDQAQKLRRRLVAQRAARTFSLDKGEFVIEDQVTVPVIPGSELDVRAVINLGAKGNLSEARLVDELAMFGVWFKMKQDAVRDLPQYGFSELDKPVIQELIAGANLADIENAHPEVGDRGVRAIVYSLASYGSCDVSSQEVPSGRIRKPSQPPQRSGDSNPPTLRRPQTAAPQAVVNASSNRIIMPEGMSLRAPRASTQPVSQTQTPAGGVRTQAPATAPRQPGSSGSFPVQRSGNSGSFPVQRPHEVTSHPALTPPPPSRTQTPITTPPRTQTPTVMPGRTPTPASTEPDPAMSRAPTSPMPGRTITGRTPTPQNPAPSVGRTITGRTPTPTEPFPMRTPTPTEPISSRTMTPLSARLPSQGGPQISRTISQSRATAPRATRPSHAPPVQSRTRSNTAATLETESLIRDRLSLVDRNADHYQLLGIAQDATPDLVRAAYFTLVRKLHPDRLASLGIDDPKHDAQRLCAQINAAFAVLNDNVRRLEYLAILARGGESAVKAEDAKADEIAMRVMHAEEAFRRGEMALRREQLDVAITEFSTALELQPQEPEYQALLVWAKFAAAPDKQAVARQTRLDLARAADRAMQSPTARFYLGRVERILGREREALEHFYEVLRIKANHAEASSEIRVLELRLKKK